jgi:FkbM family methyltransferase
MVDWIKCAVVRTPLEAPAKAARRALQFCALCRNPELYEIWMEEARIARLIRKVVHDSSNCVDVGSHLGVILSLFVKYAPKGRHLAFEPNPQQARWLERKFPEVEIRRLALGDSAGDRPLYILERRSGYSGLHSLGDPDERVQTVPTEVARLDDIVGSDRRVDFLKVVVEGAELSVLRGGDELLRRDRPFLLFECIPASLERFGDSHAALFEFLTGRHSYEIFLLKHVLNGGGPLDFGAFEEALRYPFKALKFAAAPRHDDHDMVRGTE